MKKIFDYLHLKDLENEVGIMNDVTNAVPGQLKLTRGLS